MRRPSPIRLGMLAASVLAAGLAASGARADIWKSLDAQGHVQYSDHWTPGAVLIKRGRASDQPATAAAEAQPAASDQRITDELNREAAQRAVQKDEAATHAKQCKQAQTRYQQLIRARHIYRQEKNGQREYLSDQDADKERLQARLDMQSACGTSSS